MKKNAIYGSRLLMKKNAKGKRDTKLCANFTRKMMLYDYLYICLIYVRTTNNETRSRRYRWVVRTNRFSNLVVSSHIGIYRSS